MYIIIDDFHCDAPSITPLFDFEAVKLGVAENIEWYSKRLKERTKESAYNRDERIVESMDERIVEVMNERIAEAMKDYEFLINILKSKQKFDINVTTKTGSRLIILGDVIECSLRYQEIKKHFDIQSKKINLDERYSVYEILFNLIK